MTIELSEDQGHHAGEEHQDENRKKTLIQVLIGIFLAGGMLWLFLPKFGFFDADYNPIVITESNKNNIISNYEFGRITIEGKTYRDLDVIIFQDRVKYNWAGMKDHELYPDEIQDVVNEGIETVVIGTGSMGHAFVRKETLQMLETKGITAHVMDTYKAVEFYNALPKAKLAGIFHLTE